MMAKELTIFKFALHVLKYDRSTLSYTLRTTTGTIVRTTEEKRIVPDIRCGGLCPVCSCRPDRVMAVPCVFED